MEDSKSRVGDRLTEFLDSGIYRFQDSSVVFVDPVSVLNRSYTRYRVSSSSYYPRFFDSAQVPSRKRKLNSRDPRPLNQRERLSDMRHQEARPLLLKAHKYLMKCDDLLKVLSNLRNDDKSSKESEDISPPSPPLSFLELGKVWQAPLYEIILNFYHHSNPNDHGGSQSRQCYEQRVLQAFNNLVANETENDVVAEFLGNHYIIPRESCFFMSDLREIHNLIPADFDSGFNLIVVDPPWENASARQKSRYPTLPNRYFLSLPIMKLTHSTGALVALWVTNREKLRSFVENELFPAWGASYVATFYWLKVKADGSLLSDLDLFHHRPYECLILGYCHGKGNSDKPPTFGPVKENLVVMSIPGDYSRKPPVGGLLQEYIPGPKPARCIELFAREVMAGWVAWGNEPLHYQDSRYFVER